MAEILEQALDKAGLTRYTEKVQKALAGKQDVLSGQQGQVVGFDAGGKPVAQGTESLVGPAGKDGADGKTAYQYAVDGGYTGTEEDFRTLMGSGPWLPLSGGNLSGDLLVPGYRQGGLLFSSGSSINKNSWNLKTGPYDPGYMTIDPMLYFNTSIAAFNGTLNLNGKKIEYIGLPTADYDAANKQYVDSLINTAGADFAEMFEWQDGNPDGEDRVGRLVTLDGDKLRLAGPEDGFLLGVVSAVPTVTGDSYHDRWCGKYERDVFGRILWEDKDFPEQRDEGGNIIQEAYTARVKKLNPAYDPDQPYVPRLQRPEWAAVGLTGKLVAMDDGTCEVNGWCTTGTDGVATASSAHTRLRVMARLDGNHIRVLIL